MKNKNLINALSSFFYFVVCIVILKYFVNNFEYSLLNVLLYLLSIGIYAVILNYVVNYFVEKYYK